LLHVSATIGHLHTSTEEQGTHTITKQGQGAEDNSSTEKRKKQTISYSRFLERLKMADCGRNM
jgi:hypothetical protein